MLVIDIHEPDFIKEKLQEKIPAKVLKLKYGDYSFSDVIIERKTLSDFFCSLKNDRLKYQSESMNRYYTEKYLIIEGFFDFSYVNNIKYLYSKLTELILDFNVNAIFSGDMDFTVRILRKLYFSKNFSQ